MTLELDDALNLYMWFNGVRCFSFYTRKLLNFRNIQNHSTQMLIANCLKQSFQASVPWSIYLASPHWWAMGRFSSGSRIWFRSIYKNIYSL